MYLREKGWIEWKRDFTMEIFNEKVKDVVEKAEHQQQQEGKMKKELIEYLKSWLLFVDKKPIIAAMVFNQVWNE